MRYASMIATALALPEADGPGRVAKWRQLVDLVAQIRDRLDDRDLQDALKAIERLRGDVSRDQRRRAAEAVSGRGGAVDLFGEDEPGIAAPVLMTAELSDDVWLSVIPRLPRSSRALLRNRRDLPPCAVQMLANFGPSDFALTASDKAVEDSQIRDLVARIEAFRTTLGEAPAATLPTVVTSFAFETDAAGAVDWVEGVPAPALVGLLISEPAPIGGPGVDGQASGAFWRRAPFRDARLALPGGVAGGDWLISGNPRFDPNTGRFAGYRAEARRPRRDEIAGPISTIAGSAFPADSLRALVHELRTPLNAILGFASMIEDQIIGPVGSPYRVRAAQIRDDGERLLALIEELDTAAKPDDRIDQGAPISDLKGHLRVQLDDAISLHRRRGVLLLLTGDADLAVPLASESALSRSMIRVLASLFGIAEDGEHVEVVVNGAGRFAEVVVQRPAALAGRSTEALLDAGPMEEGTTHGGSALGLGFAIRVLDSALRAAGGYLSILPERLIMAVPLEGARDNGTL